jgi:DNA-binding CsgD family transcriptional regulator
VATTDAAHFRLDGQDYAYLSLPQWEVPTTSLTDAEREVYRMLCAGLSNLQIAEQRRASVHTVSNQLTSMFRKSRVMSRHELVAAPAEPMRGVRTLLRAEARLQVSRWRCDLRARSGH